MLSYMVFITFVTALFDLIIKSSLCELNHFSTKTREETAIMTKSKLTSTLSIAPLCDLIFFINLLI